MIRRERPTTLLVETLARTESLAAVTASIANDPTLSRLAEPWAQIGQSLALGGDAVAATYVRLRSAEPALGPLVILAWWLNRGELDPETVWQELALLREAVPSDAVPDRTLTDTFELLVGEDRPGEGPGEVSAQAPMDPAAGLSGATADYARALLAQHLARSLEERGEFGPARALLRDAYRRARSHDLVRQWDLVLQLARVSQRLGDYTGVVNLLGDEALRREATESARFEFLIDTHFATAAAAFGTEQAELAFREIVAAGELLDRPDAPRDDQRNAQLLLRSGQVEALLGNSDEASDLLRAAIDAFEALNPADHQGATEARLVLADRALAEDDASLAAKSLAELSAEADASKAPWELPERLALATYPFATIDPPSREDYDTLLLQLAQIHDPVLQFKARSNLYVHALMFLDRKDQADLLIELRRMGQRIHRETFARLYEHYVIARYPFAIESRLARLQQPGGER
ncbi:MAG: hypothetical protein AB7O52_19490 [Planctomycetota bacterium]